MTRSNIYPAVMLLVCLAGMCVLAAWACWRL